MSDRRGFTLVELIIVALLGLVLYPLVWLLLLPFRLVGIAVGGVLALVKAIIYLPARLLGHRPS